MGLRQAFLFLMLFMALSPIVSCQRTPTIADRIAEQEELRRAQQKRHDALMQEGKKRVQMEHEKAEIMGACGRLAAHPHDPQNDVHALMFMGAGQPLRIQSRLGVPDNSLDIPAALEACTTAVERYPDNPWAAFMLGRVLFAGGEDELARDYLELAADGGHHAAFGYLGLLENDSERSEQLIAQAAAGKFTAFQTMLDVNRESEINALCDQLAAHPRDSMNAYSLTGGVEEDDAIDVERASEACIEAVKLSPNVPSLQFQLGRVLYAGGLYDEAREHLELAQKAESRIAAKYLERINSTPVSDGEIAPPTAEEILAYYKDRGCFIEDVCAEIRKIENVDCFQTTDSEFSCEYVGHGSMKTGDSSMDLALRMFTQNRFEVLATLRKRFDGGWDITEELAF